MTQAQAQERLEALLDRLAPLVSDTPEPEPERMAVLWQQAQAALQTGDGDKALSTWGELVAMRPGEPSFQFGYAMALQALDQLAFAGRHYAYAYALDPTDAATAFRLGECLAALGETLEAHDALLAAQQLCDLPHNPPHIREMALRLMHKLQ